MSETPLDLDDLERRATIDAQRLDGKHGDPARAGGWIGHRDYARALVLLIPRLRKAEAASRVVLQDARPDIDVMPMINGKSFRCLDCNANVFRHDPEDAMVFVCNGCGSRFRAEPSEVTIP